MQSCSLGVKSGFWRGLEAFPGIGCQEWVPWMFVMVVSLSHLGAVGELSWFLPHLRGFCGKTFSESQQHILSWDGHSQGVCSAWSGI